ncbi:AraC family transcriptional regulator [Catenovulum sediminis]|uniref:Helix-turn-helix domain-containing protein n=1 Tax=Catenovulum sediminis TaxID=1740262 RepID=A0ABV1RLV2_9ALTE|nr:helix-turn-helix domain-containing protein [Catenovulum sediminis]
MLIYVVNNVTQASPGLTERIYNLHDVFLFVTVCEAMLLAVYRLLPPTKRTLESYLLAAFMLIIAIDCLCLIFMWNPELKSASWLAQTLLLYVYIVAELLRGPVFLLFILSLTRKDFSLKLSHLLHFISPILVIFLFSVFAIQLDNYRFAQGSFNQQLSARIIWYMTILISIIYATAVIWAVKKHYQDLQVNYSSFSLEQVIWLTIFSCCFMLVWAWSLLIAFTDDIWGGPTADSVATAYSYLVFILINILMLFNLKYTQQITQSKEVKIENDTAIEDDFTQDNWQQLTSQIKHALDESKIYLQPNLTIEDLALTVGSNVKDVSTAINKIMQTNFYELINFHRVEHAKRLLLQESTQTLSIMDILLQSGFNNKSSFHRFFNRFVQMSPSQYRKQHL